METTVSVRSLHRLEWLDALRGFTMLLVVAYHVFDHGFVGSIKQSDAISFQMLFRMPTFFFISGFLAYKASAVWTWDYLMDITRRKLAIQIIPAVVFFLAFLLLCKPSFGPALDDALASPTKAGYWFTWALLHMFVVYYVWCYLFERICGKWCPSRTPSLHIIVLWLMALGVYATMHMPAWFHWHEHPFWNYSSLQRSIYYFHFFLFGNLVHRHWGQAQRLMDSAWFFPLVLVVTFWGVVDNLHWHVLRMQWANLPRTLGMYGLIFLLFMFFRHYAEWFRGDHFVGRSLQYIGVRTLDIYLIHFFFLPNLTDVGTWLKAHPHNFVLEMVLTMALAVVIIGFSLLTSHLLRISTVLKKWLFGR